MSEVPAVGLLRQLFEAPVEPDPEAAAERETAAVLSSARRAPGSVAVGVGSRGVANLEALVRGAVRTLRAAGWDPFIVPAMGSHGGATAEGQVAVLAGYGVTEVSVGAPVRATMDTVVVGEVDSLPVHHDALAAAAGASFLVCRVKPHTDFHGRWESGLAKMAAIGMGKRSGAQVMHSAGVPGLRDLVPQAARLLAGQGRLLGGLAAVENQRDQTALVRGVPAAGIAGDLETELLERARKLMPRLPFDRLDVLVVDRMGKDISGTGLDTNVLNRMRIVGEPEPEGLHVVAIAVLELTAASHGNAIGVGLADFIPERLRRQIDVPATYANSLTAGIVGLERAKLPMTMPSDRDAVLAAISARGRPPGEPLALAWIADTLHTEVVAVTQPLWRAAEGRLERLAEPRPMPFGPDGRLAPLAEFASSG
ncbi:MAG: DUF2088 domain-containing protein [Chloroflexota bacterium]